MHLSYKYMFRLYFIYICFSIESQYFSTGGLCFVPYRARVYCHKQVSFLKVSLQKMRVVHQSRNSTHFKDAQVHYYIYRARHWPVLIQLNSVHPFLLTFYFFKIHFSTFFLSTTISPK
jgi:hypothetical protein